VAKARRWKVQPSMVFVVVAVLAAIWWAFAARDDHDFSRPPPATFTDSQLASLDGEERALVRWLADTAPEWEGLAIAVGGFDEATARQDIRNLERSCREITDAAELVESRLPAPHPDVDRSLRDALAGYAAGGDACRAVARGEVDQFPVMAASFDAGDQAFEAAAALLPEVPCPDGTTTNGIEAC
jgi:hypothetical protein